MTQLAVIGPYLWQIPSSIHFGPESFARFYEDPRRDLSPLVAEMYFAAGRFAQRIGIEASFPIMATEQHFDQRIGIEVSFPAKATEMDKVLRAQWVDAVQRLARADAVFGVDDDESQATALEAMLARRMDLPLLVAYTGTRGAQRFENAPFPVIDAQLGTLAVEQAIETMLFGEGAKAQSSKMTW